MDQELLPDGTWPPFVAPAPGRSDRGYGRIAAYVSPRCLARVGAALPGGARQRAGAGPRHEVDLKVAELLYAQMAETNLSYAHEEWEPTGGQRVRDPERLLWGRAEGTCLDLAALYAALCLAADLQIALVILRRADGSGHVAVAVRPGGSADDDLPPLRGTSPVAEGVFEMDGDLEDLPRHPDLVIVDVVRATEGTPFGEAVRRESLSTGHYPFIHLVDVAARHRGGDQPLPPPEDLSTLSVDLPVPVLPDVVIPTRQSEGREQLSDRLSRSAGVVVLRGPSGTGKTTLALRAAAALDHGKGWLLTASSPTALRSALVAREMAERGLVLGTLEPEEAGGLASAAVLRLRSLDRPWVLVLDNADAGAAGLQEVLALPRREHGQLVLVTSTAPASAWAGHDVVEIGELSQAEALAALPDERLVNVSAGRLVLVTALRSLLRANPGLLDLPEAAAALDAPVADVGTDPAEQGAGQYLGLLRLAVGDGPEVVALLEALPWLPPDRLPPATLIALAGARGSETIDRLVACGLLGQVEAGESGGGKTLTVHRLLQTALRRQTSAAALIRLLPQPAIQQLLLAAADRPLVQALRESLYAVLGHEGSGVALWSLAVVSELHDGPHSAATFARAEARLSEEHPEERPMLADCLHARARIVNQKAPSDRTIDDVVAARGWAARALDLREEGDLIGRARHQALDALLRKALALTLPPSERAVELQEVLRLLEESHRLRAEALQDHPLVDRAHYNLAGASIDLAQVAPDLADGLLTSAEGIYRDCLRYRQRLYGRPNPLVASCQWGTGLTLYVRAVLGLGPTVPLLRAATTSTLESLVEREQLAPSSADSGDVGKSVRLLTKIAAARFLLTVSKERRADAGRDLLAELHQELVTEAEPG